MIIIRLRPGAARARRENINLECIYQDLGLHDLGSGGLPESLGSATITWKI
jgi:hypothetical protein